MNADSNGHPWGVRFEGGRERAVDPDRVRPWEWSDTRLREAASNVVIVNEWNDDLELELAFGSRRFRGMFKLGLLQQWNEI